MDFTEVVFARRMTRQFRSEAIAEETLDQLCRAALRSPTAGSTHGIDLLVLTEEMPRQRFWELIATDEWRSGSVQSAGLMAAPVIIVPLGNPRAYEERYRSIDKRGSSLAGLDTTDWPVPYWTVDASFAAMTLLLGATDVGLDALFFQLQRRERELLAGFAIPEHFVPIGAVAIGRPSIGPTPPGAGMSPRRPVEETVHRERW